MRQWKIASSLAIIGALAAPFAFRTYNAPWPMAETWVPLYVGEREDIVRRAWPNNCDELEGLSPVICRMDQRKLKEGGIYLQRPSLLLYLARNAAAALAGFVLIFGLTFLLPALIRRYWKWLNT